VSTASRDSWGVTHSIDPIRETNGGQMSLDRLGPLGSVTPYVLCDASCCIQSGIINWGSPKSGSKHPPLTHYSSILLIVGGGGLRCECDALDRRRAASGSYRLGMAQFWRADLFLFGIVPRGILWCSGVNWDPCFALSFCPGSRLLFSVFA